MTENRRFEKELDLDEIIDKLMRSWGFENKKTELDVIDAWEELMGKGVANRTTKIAIYNKVLHLKLNSAVMRDELQYGRSVIIQRINDFAGKEVITDIWFE